MLMTGGPDLYIWHQSSISISLSGDNIISFGLVLDHEKSWVLLCHRGKQRRQFFLVKYSEWEMTRKHRSSSSRMGYWGFQNCKCKIMRFNLSKFSSLKSNKIGIIVDYRGAMGEGEENKKTYFRVKINVGQTNIVSVY